MKTETKKAWFWGIITVAICIGSYFASNYTTDKCLDAIEKVMDSKEDQHDKTRDYGNIVFSFLHFRDNYISVNDTVEIKNERRCEI